MSQTKRSLKLTESEKHHTQYIREQLKILHENMSELEVTINELKMRLEEVEELCPLVNNWRYNLREMYDMKMDQSKIKEIFTQGHTKADLQVGAWRARDIDVKLTINQNRETCVSYNGLDKKRFERYVVSEMPHVNLNRGMKM